MPSVLDCPQDMAREKLKESSPVMEITGSEYSDNYTEGQVMGQDIPGRDCGEEVEHCGSDHQQGQRQGRPKCPGPDSDDG